jgi:hypothetical protein
MAINEKSANRILEIPGDIKKDRGKENVQRDVFYGE